jgi:hypothetical protein
MLYTYALANDPTLIGDRPGLARATLVHFKSAPCAVCGMPWPPRKCKYCSVARYCGSDCHDMDWEVHHDKDCRMLRQVKKFIKFDLYNGNLPSW